MYMYLVLILHLIMNMYVHAFSFNNYVHAFSFKYIYVHAFTFK